MLRRKRTQNGVSTTASLSSVSDGTYRGGTVTDTGTTPEGGAASAAGTARGSAGGGARQVTCSGSAAPTDHLSTPATGRSSQDGASGGTTVTTSERTSSSSSTGIGAGIGTEGLAGGATSRSNRDRDYGGGDLGPVANSDELLDDQTHVLLPRRVAENNKQIKVLKERIQRHGKKGLFKKCKFIACEEACNR